MATPITLDAPKAYHLPRWNKISDPERLKFLRSVAEQRGRDPRIRELAFRLIAGIRERDYPAQAAALLKAVQPGGPLMAYVNEPGEVLQDPLYTLKVKAGDCDDAALLLSSLFEAIRMPWRYVLSGVNTLTKERVRWVEGTPYPRGVRWAHIYLQAGWPVFKPTTWVWAEPTVRNAPLGWDVTGHMERTGNAGLPELGDAGAPTLPTAPTAVTVTAPPSAFRDIAARIGGSVAGSTQRGIVETVLISVTATVLATAVLDYLRARKVIPTPSR
jgi:hypothetical protein